MSRDKKEASGFRKFISDAFSGDYPDKTRLFFEGVLSLSLSLFSLILSIMMVYLLWTNLA